MTSYLIYFFQAIVVEDLQLLFLNDQNEQFSSNF